MRNLERYKANSFIFDHKPEGDFIVFYPVKTHPYFEFFLKTEDDELYELGLPKEVKQEIMGEIINMNLDDYWIDTTDYANLIYKE